MNNRFGAIMILMFLIAGFLTFDLVVLRVCNAIQLSWLWVLSPIWLVNGVLCLAIIGYMIVVFWKERPIRRRGS